jgi:tetratricopeptide (TPR) repeat protein
MLADLYLQADSYVPALETIERLLSLPGARALSPARRAALEAKAVACRLGQGDCQAALAHCRDLLRDEAKIDSLPIRARLHLLCANALFELARFPDCREHAERALRMADECGDLSLSASALNQLGMVAYREGDLHRTRDLYEQALALHRRLGDEWAAARVRKQPGPRPQEPVRVGSRDRASLRCARELPASRPLRGHRSRAQEPRHRLPEERGLAAGDECYRGAEEVFLQVGDDLLLARVAIGRGNIARLQRRFLDAESLLLGAVERARSHDARREEVLGARVPR